MGNPRHALAPSSRSARRLLPPGVSVEHLADGARLALTSFLELAERGASRRELAAWLVGPYADAVRFTVRLGPSAPNPESGPPDGHVDAGQLATLVRNAARDAERVLLAFHSDPDTSVAERLIARGLVEPMQDDSGRIGYAPQGPTHMRLSVRVLALVVADMLTRPEELRSQIIVDELGVRLRERAPRSGVMIARPRHTVPYVPSDGDERAGAWPVHEGRSSPPASLEELARAADRIPDEDG